MTIPRNDAEGLQQPAEPGALVRGDDALGRILMGWVTRTYGMSDRDAAALLGEARFSFFTTARGLVQDERAWVIGGVVQLAETHQRIHRLPRKTEDVAAKVVRIRDIALTAEALAVLPENAREAIRLRYSERMSYAEIAEELGVAARYAEHLVMHGVAKLRALQRRQRAEEKR
ncbi:MAG TPA: sigma factor-like helix-turn-helix DNA-binding protein [Thermoanaerobaculia bacterium]|jgi:DNA-directed RNA polymerase specialized sigma24 family protein|nr:sigma factor-like helix-turn-helix DNA-binding protein [Thermoanaerobaculia bacterium]